MIGSDRKKLILFSNLKKSCRSDRLPEGLHTVGMGLGEGGQPLLDVRENLPSPADMGNIGAAMGPSNAANVGTAALQAALATIMGMGGMGGQGGQGAGMGGQGAPGAGRNFVRDG